MYNTGCVCVGGAGLVRGGGAPVCITLSVLCVGGAGLVRGGGAPVCVGGWHGPHLLHVRHLQVLLFHGPGGQGHKNFGRQVQTFDI